MDVVNSGQRCLELLAGGSYDVLLLDNHLPDMDGTSILLELAAREISIPVVMVTGVGDEALVVQVLRLGACDYVTKEGPYLATLPAVIRNAVAEHGTPRDERSSGGLRPRSVSVCRIQRGGHRADRAALRRSRAPNQTGCRPLVERRAGPTRGAHLRSGIDGSTRSGHECDRSPDRGQATARSMFPSSSLPVEATKPRPSRP